MRVRNAFINLFITSSPPVVLILLKPLGDRDYHLLEYALQGWPLSSSKTNLAYHLASDHARTRRDRCDHGLCTYGLQTGKLFTPQILFKPPFTHFFNFYLWFSRLVTVNTKQICESKGVHLSRKSSVLGLWALTLLFLRLSGINDLSYSEFDGLCFWWNMESKAMMMILLLLLACQWWVSSSPSSLLIESVDGSHSTGVPSSWGSPSSSQVWEQGEFDEPSLSTSQSTQIGKNPHLPLDPCFKKRYGADESLSSHVRSNWGAVVATFVFVYTATFGASWVLSIDHLLSHRNLTWVFFCLLFLGWFFLSLVDRSLARSYGNHAPLRSCKGWMCESLSLSLNLTSSKPYHQTQSSPLVSLNRTLSGVS